MAREIVDERTEVLTPAPEATATASPEIEIEIIDDTPEEDRNRPPAKPEPEAKAAEPATHEEELDSYSDNVQKRMNQLTHRYHDERRAKEALERQNQEALALAKAVWEENQRLQAQYNAGAEDYFKQVQSKIDYAQKLADDKLRKAYEAGDTEGLIEAQKIRDEISLERHRLDSLNLRPQPPQNPRQNEALQPQQEVYNPPRETQAPQRDVKAEEWAAKNPWFGADEEMTSLAYGLHTKLVKSGVDPKSDEYYHAIDGRMRDVFPDYFGKPKEKPRTSSPVAPAGRTTAGKNKLTLTATQVTLAKRLGVPLEAYARQVAKLQESSNG